MLLDALLSRKSYKKVTLKDKTMLLTNFVNLILGFATEWKNQVEELSFQDRI